MRPYIGFALYGYQPANLKLLKIYFLLRSYRNHLKEVAHDVHKCSIIQQCVLTTVGNSMKLQNVLKVKRPRCVLTSVFYSELVMNPVDSTPQQTATQANTGDFLGISHNKAMNGICFLPFLLCTASITGMYCSPSQTMAHDSESSQSTLYTPFK